MKCNAYEYLIRNVENKFYMSGFSKVVDIFVIERKQRAKQKLNVTLRKGHLILVTDKRSEFYHKLNNVNKDLK